MHLVGPTPGCGDRGGAGQQQPRRQPTQDWGQEEQQPVEREDHGDPDIVEVLEDQAEQGKQRGPD